MGLTYFRLLYVVTVDPGYVPLGSRLHADRTKESKTRRPRRKDEENIDGGAIEKPGNTVARNGADRRSTKDSYTSGGFLAHGTPEPAPGLQDFYNRDVFVCQGDGRPIWCTTCENWKPDRAHHCREIERCVRKMDHFCPW